MLFGHYYSNSSIVSDNTEERLLSTYFMDSGCFLCNLKHIIGNVVGMLDLCTHMGIERERLCSMMLHALDPNAGIVIMTGQEIVCYGFFLEIDTEIVVGRG